MPRGDYYKKTLDAARKISAARSGSEAWYFLDAVNCARVHGASPENYFVLRFFELDESQRARFLTSGRSAAADKVLNRRASAREREIMRRKNLFNASFAAFIERESVFAPECDFECFRVFLDRNPVVFVKPARGTMGRGVRRLKSTEIGSLSAFYDECRKAELLLEQPIIQHPALESLSMGCVNSVRINAARDKNGKTRLIGACLKCGGTGASADNFHSGGVAFPLDLVSGTITGLGRNNTELRDFLRPPAADLRMPGFTLPNWESVLSYVYGAMDVLPGVGYVGWDIAVTKTGAELIEGNCSWPGGNIIQFDGVGKYPLLKACLGEGHDEKHYF